MPNSKNKNKNKRKAHHAGGQRNKGKWKKKPRELFWIEDAKEACLPLEKDDTAKSELGIVLTITRVQLQDDYTQTNLLTAILEEAVVERAEPGQGEIAAAVESAQPDDTDEKEQSSSDAEQKEASIIKIEVTDSTSIEHTSDSAPVVAATTDNKIAEDKMEDSIAKDTAKSKTEIPSTPKDGCIIIKRCSSARGRPIHNGSNDDFKSLPNGDCGDGIVNPHSKDHCPDKFWSQRRRLFTRFDDGIKLDKESWYSVTPEAIANHIARRAVEQFPARTGIVVLDPFCGCGGNIIAFARRPEVAFVICVDTDEKKLKRAKANAKIYNVPEGKMIFIHGDACEIMSCYKDGRKVSDAPNSVPATEVGDEEDTQTQSLPETVDSIFLSPPWGGIDYAQVGKRNYTLSNIQLGSAEKPVTGDDLLKMAAAALGAKKAIQYFLPRNTNGTQLAHSALEAGLSGRMEMEQNLLNGKLKTVTAYLGM